MSAYFDGATGAPLIWLNQTTFINQNVQFYIVYHKKKTRGVTEASLNYA